MKLRNLSALAVCAIAAAALLLSCSGTSATSDDSLANSEVQASMSSTEAGADYTVTADLAEATGTAAKALSAPSGSEARATVTITAGKKTFAVAYYDGLDGEGNELGSTPGEIPAGTQSAVISSTRVFAVDASRGDSTVTVTSSYVVNNIAMTTGSWEIAGTVEVLRNITLANGTSVACDAIHTLDWGVSASDGTIEKGGSASTIATVQVNDGRSFDLGYEWDFQGDGTAVMTTDRGSTVTVTIE